MLLLVLGHVQAHHGVLVVEEEPGQGPDQLRLADAGRPEEHEAPDGPARVFETGAAPADSLRDGSHRFLLVDEALVDALLHVEQLLGLSFQHLGYRDAGPVGNQPGDVLGGYLFTDFFLL